MGIKKLQNENERIRENIRKYLSEFMKPENITDVELMINILIENEIEQEGLCTG